MPIVLYHVDPSPQCEKVRLALALESLEYQSLAVDGDDRSEVRQISGQSDLPVLVEEDGTVIVEANRILRHLGAAEGSRLLPDGRRNRALTRLLVDRSDAVLGPVCRDLSSSEADVGATPTEERRRILQRRLADELALLEGMLGADGYLFGARPTVADVVAHAFLNRLPSTEVHPLLGEFPRVAGWFGRLLVAAGRPPGGSRE